MRKNLSMAICSKTGNPVFWLQKAYELGEIKFTGEISAKLDKKAGRWTQKVGKINGSNVYLAETIL